jgi:hypothetical protein
MPAPIVLFVFNRPWHTEQTVLSLLRNELADQSELIIFADGPRSEADIPKVDDVRRYLHTIRGFKSIEIVESDVNKGLANSVIAGVTRVLDQHETVIVLEDDMVTSPYFLSYMNQGLELYAHDDRVISIHGYMYPVSATLPDTFFIKGAECWGWATWKRGWALFERNTLKLLMKVLARNAGKEFNVEGSYPYTVQLFCQYIGYIDSWAIRWYASAFLNNKLTLYPGTSLVKNIGMDNSGVHVKNWSKEFLDTSVQLNAVHLSRIEIEENKFARNALAEYYRRIGTPLSRKIINRLRRYWPGKTTPQTSDDLTRGTEQDGR